jgi:PAS domain S-box-containing protein
MPQSLRVLVVEDNPLDAELLLRELRRAGFDPQWQRVETEEDYLAQLEPSLDIVLSDHVLPQFSGSRALELLKERKLDLPFIIVSGTIGEELAVQAIKNGATDYLLKDRLTRLGPAVRHALAQRQMRMERERTRSELIESDERFRQVVENIGEVFWMTNLDRTRMLYISPGYREIWGRTCESLYNEPGLWLASVHPEDRERVLAAMEKQPRGNYDEEYRIVRPNGDVRVIRDRAFPVRDNQGIVYRLAGVAEDITERKMAEIKLRQQAAMLDLAHEAIIVRDFKTEQILFWNKGAERMYEWTAEEALEQQIGELLCVDTTVPMKVSEALAQKGEWHGESHHISKSGRKLVVNTRATLIRDSAGQPQAVLSINADVTEQRKLEAQFLRAQRMESIGTLASGVAHDLNNILAPIMMSVPLLRTNLSPESRDSIITTIEMSAERGAQIVKQVLAFGRGLDGEKQPMSVLASISELGKIMRQTFPKDISVETDTESDLWMVMGDATQLHQVLLNLCVNARDAMPNGGMLKLSARNVEVDENYAAMLADVKAGRYVVVRVIDEGTGIPPEILGRIFDPFFTTKGVGKGTGLGLSTVLGIVKSHGGAIQVSSEIGKGTVFQVYLPAVEESERAEGDEVPLPPSPGSGELVLVVDDEATVRGAAQSVLEANGYRVLCAADGTEALAVFAQHSDEVSVVITDLMMPFMDGIALARALRKMRPDLQVVASTGLGEKTQLAELKRVGVDVLLHKPYGADSLLRVVYQLLHPGSEPPPETEPAP